MTRFIAAWLALAALMADIPAAAAATLRAMVELRGSTVHLSDLFAGLDSGQDCALGDSPPPGSRLVILQPQIEAIAAQFGVAWEASQTDETVTLDRPGRVLSGAAVLSMVKGALAAEAGIRHASVSLSGFAEQKIDLDAAIDVGEVAVDPARDHFDAVVTATVNHHETLRLPVEGSVERLLSLPVLTRTIVAGEIIDEGDLVMADIPAGRVRGDVVEQSRDIVGLTSSHGLPVGLPIARSDLRQPNIVLRGGAILMRLTSAGIEVAAQGQSLQAGALAERIRVLNPVSHAILVATVIGPNEVRVDPDSLPTVQNGPYDFGSTPRFATGAVLASNSTARYSADGGRP